MKNDKKCRHFPITNRKCPCQTSEEPQVKCRTHYKGQKYWARAECNECNEYLKNHPEFSEVKESETELCYSCGGKGTYSQIHGETGSDDFGGEGYEKKPSIHNYPCKACNGTGLKEKLPPCGLRSRHCCLCGIVENKCCKECKDFYWSSETVKTFYCKEMFCECHAPIVSKGEEKCKHGKIDDCNSCKDFFISFNKEDCCGECVTKASGAPDETVNECTNPKCEYCPIPPKAEVSEWEIEKTLLPLQILLATTEIPKELIDENIEGIKSFIARVRDQTLEACCEALEKKKKIEDHTHDNPHTKYPNRKSRTGFYNVAIESAQSTIRSLKR